MVINLAGSLKWLSTIHTPLISKPPGLGGFTLHLLGDKGKGTTKNPLQSGNKCTYWQRVLFIKQKEIEIDSNKYRQEANEVQQ